MTNYSVQLGLSRDNKSFTSKLFKVSAEDMPTAIDKAERIAKKQSYKRVYLEGVIKAPSKKPRRVKNT